MNILSEPRLKTAYYFTSSDNEILDDYLLALSCDEETWLYKVGDSTFNNHYENFKLDSTLQDQFKHPSRGFVDGRTFTRRKLRPSLDSVMESPLSNNRSSLGLLNQSKLLNDSLVSHPLPDQDKTSLNSTVFDEKESPPRVFKLDTPLINTAPLEIKNRVFSRNLTFDRMRVDSECSDYSLPQSLDQINSFDQNCVMTASLTNFLEKNEVSCPPPTAFEDDDGMANSIISLSGNHEDLNLDNTGKNGQMTDSLVGFLEHVKYKPPSGFEDNEVETNQEPAVYLSNHRKKHFINDIESHATNNLISGISTNTTASMRDENIPPEGKIPGKLLTENGCKERSDLLYRFEKQLNKPNYGTYKIANKDGVVIKNGGKEPNNSMTVSINSANLARNVKQLEEFDESKTKTLSTNKETFGPATNERALNNRDLNVTREIYSDEENELAATKMLSNKSIPGNNNNKVNTTFNRNNTFYKSESVETSARQIPQKNSTFNTTFTKLEAPASKGMNSTFVKSMDGLNGGLEDDQTSSASDSSFSSCSTKPRSVDELRTIAQLQENSLVQQTSTPEENNKKQSYNLAKLNLELSPIRRVSTGDSRTSESRSANCSPVRRPNYQSPYPHPISRMQQPTVEARRQMLQASSLSNIARPKCSGLRLPQPVNRYVSSTETTFTRPATAPTPALTGIPRPQASRLPQPRNRGTGIPGPKRGGVR